MLYSPSAERNKEPILQVLKQILPNGALKVLEIASGTGQHVTHFAQTLTNITWQPTELDEQSVSSIAAYVNQAELKNVNPAVAVDVTKPVSQWPDVAGVGGGYDAILCSNMIHISPWECTVGLFTAAGAILKPRGLLVTYGPYAVDGVLTPQSNISFDQGLRYQNPKWGVRDVKDLKVLGQQNKLEFKTSIDMPANNKVLVFEKQG